MIAQNEVLLNYSGRIIVFWAIILAYIPRAENREPPEDIIALEQQQNVGDFNLQSFFFRVWPFECRAAFKPLDDLNPAVTVPNDRFDCSLGSAAEQEDRLGKGFELHLVLNDVCQAG